MSIKENLAKCGGSKPEPTQKRPNVTPGGKILVSYNVDYGRQGNVTGMFVTTKDKLSEIGTVHFGEILGKHSEVSIDFIPDYFKVKSEDQDFIDKLVEIIGSTTISGYNPLDYLEE